MEDQASLELMEFPDLSYVNLCTLAIRLHYLEAAAFIPFFTCIGISWSKRLQRNDSKDIFIVVYKSCNRIDANNSPVYTTTFRTGLA